MAIRRALYQTHSGVVSLLTVMFFIVLVSVLGLGFLRLSIDEQAQTLNDDLSRSALSAARSGTEIAKKYLLDCKRGDAAACAQINAATTCPGLVPVGGEVIGAAAFEQRATCVLVDQTTETIVGRTTTGNNGDLYPLTSNQMRRGVTMTIKWHSPLPGEDGPANLGGLPAATANPPVGSWPANRPGVMRITFFTFIPNNSTATGDGLATVYLKLSGGGAAPTTITPGSKFQNATARCVASTTDYICQERIVLNHLPDPMPAGAVVYAHIATEYRTAFYELGGEFGGAPVEFIGVQPEVDSTGLTSGTVRRVKTRLSYSSNGFYPRDSLATGEGICKDMFISALAPLSDISCP